MGVMVDSSLGSATVAGDKLRVPPAAMAAGDMGCVIPIQGLSFPFVRHAHLFCFCLFWHFFLFPHLDVLGTFPSALVFLFVGRKETYVAYIFEQYPEYWYFKTCLLVISSFFASLFFLSLCFPCTLTLFFFLLLRTSVSLQPTSFSSLCRFRYSYPVRVWRNILTVCAMCIAVS